MCEREYQVTDGVTGCRLATGMTLDMALVFIRGYDDTFFNEDINIKIECSMVKYDQVEQDGAK